MKSFAELEAIRQRTLDKVTLRHECTGTRILVGMGTCGIAAGAREVMLAMLAETGKNELLDVAIMQTGCLGDCGQEPVVAVCIPGKEDVTYTNVKPEMAARIVAEHVVNGQPVAEYLK